MFLLVTRAFFDDSQKKYVATDDVIINTDHINCVKEYNSNIDDEFDGCYIVLIKETMVVKQDKKFFINKLLNKPDFKVET